MTVRLYLDIDGVLNAPLAASKWKDILKFKANVFPMTVALDLVRELERLITTYNVELVWLTTWNQDNDVETYVLPFLKDHGLQSGRILGTPGGHTYSGWVNGDDWKIKALIADQKESPSDFIWIDDVEVPLYGNSLLLPDPKATLAIAPNENYGISPGAVKEIEMFLQNHS